jgi:hypothetical protein
MGGGRIFLKSRRDVSFKKSLSNEPTFGLIHLAGQYLEDPGYQSMDIRMCKLRRTVIKMF